MGNFINRRFNTGTWQSDPAPQGCICPPTSEQTCQNPTCPRKPVTIKVRAGTAGGKDA